MFNACRQFIRMVPVLPHDEIDMDNAGGAAEDHVGRQGFALGTKGRDEGSADAPGVAFPAEQKVLAS